jgi:hypothetical protein
MPETTRLPHNSDNNQELPSVELQPPIAGSTATKQQLWHQDPINYQTSCNYEILSQPKARPISQEQLVTEIKGIYAGLVVVEGTCIQADLKQEQLAKEAPPGSPPKLDNEQYKALIALRQTLFKYYDFILACRHPSATNAMWKLPIKYDIPARRWHHGIHSFSCCSTTDFPRLSTT